MFTPVVYSCCVFHTTFVSSTNKFAFYLTAICFVFFNLHAMLFSVVMESVGKSFSSVYSNASNHKLMYVLLSSLLSDNYKNISF